MTPQSDRELERVSVVKEETSESEALLEEDADPPVPHEFQGWKNIWTSPPTLLPGPENHPFFTALWDGSLPDMKSQEKEQQRTTEDDSRSYSQVGETPQHMVPPPIFPFGPNLVYPFIPAPTLSMLPTTPESEVVREASNHVLPGTPPIATPELSTSSTHFDSPDSRASISNREIFSMPAYSPTHGMLLQSTDEKPAQPPSNPAAEGEPVCRLTYMRVLPNECTNEPGVLLDGQIWQSGSKRKGGWRRNQWVVVVR